MPHVIQHQKFSSVCQDKTFVPSWYPRSAWGTWISCNVMQLLCMVSRGSTLEWHVPCTPSCLKFYLCYKLFPVPNSYFTILFNHFSLFICLLSVTNQPHFHFYLAWFCYKNPVHRRSNPDHYYPSEQVTENSSNFIFRLYNFIILLPFTTYHLLCPFITYFITCVMLCLATHSLSSYHIKVFIEFFSYYILLFLIPSYRLLKKESTSPHSIILFAGSSHCKCIIAN